jgi:hypothetical protein
MVGFRYLPKLMQTYRRPPDEGNGTECLGATHIGKCTQVRPIPSEVAVLSRGDDPLSPLIRRLSNDMPELMEEVVAFIERRTAELNDHGASSRPPQDVTPALVRAAPTPQDGEASKAAVTLLDTRVLARIDANAKRVGISRTAWLHVAADERLEKRS